MSYQFDPPYYAIEQIYCLKDASAYGLGMPRDQSFNPLKIDGRLSQIAVYQITPSSMQQNNSVTGCSLFNVVMVDVTMSHYPGFYIELQAWAVEQSSGSFSYLTFAISETMTDLNKIGTAKNAVFQIKLPHDLNCQSNNMHYRITSQGSFTDTPNNRLMSS